MLNGSETCQDIAVTEIMQGFLFVNPRFVLSYCVSTCAGKILSGLPSQSFYYSLYRRCHGLLHNESKVNEVIWGQLSDHS